VDTAVEKGMVEVMEEENMAVVVMVEVVMVEENMAEVVMVEVVMAEANMAEVVTVEVVMAEDYMDTDANDPTKMRKITINFRYEVSIISINYRVRNVVFKGIFSNISDISWQSLLLVDNLSIIS
jgi:hypothetical protein